MSYLIASPSMQDPYFGNSVVCLCSYDTKGAFGFVLNKPIPLTIAELLLQLPEVKEWHAEHNSSLSLKETLEKRMFLLQPIRFGGPVNVECGFIMFEAPENMEVKSYDNQPSDDTSNDSVQVEPNILYLYHLDALWKIHPATEQNIQQEIQQEETKTSTNSSQTKEKEILILPAKGNITSLLAHNIPFKIFLGYSGWGEQQLTTEVERGSWLFAHQTDFTLQELFMVPIENQYDLALSSLGIQKEFLVMKPIEA